MNIYEKDSNHGIDLRGACSRCFSIFELGFLIVKYLAGEVVNFSLGFKDVGSFSVIYNFNLRDFSFLMR